MPAEVETMAFNEERGLPWHGLGVPVQGAMTSEEALTKAGLNWTVGLEPVFYHRKGAGDISIPGQFATVRNEDGVPLGVVGSSYRVYQNAEAFTFADSLVDAGGAKYDTAGSLREGRLVFMSMEIPGGVNVPGDDGEMKPYLLLVNGHDGKKSLTVVITPVRVVCLNTLNLAISGADRRFFIRHTTKMEGKVQQARETIGLTFEYMGDLVKVAESLLVKKVTEDQVEKILAKVFPLPKKAPQSVVEKSHFFGALETYRTSPNLDNVRGSAWAVVNAVSEYLDHQVVYREGRRWTSSDVKARSILLGGMAEQTKDKVLALVSDGRRMR